MMKLMQFLLMCGWGSSKIKIMTIDGVWRKYQAPMSVKEALVDFPNHAVFRTDAVRKLGCRARPLHPTVAMEPGKLYFLVPLPQATSRKPNTQETSGNLMDRSTMEKQGTRSSRRVSFADSPFYIEPTSTSVNAPSEGHAFEQMNVPRKPSLEVLPTSEHGNIRLKMVVSKEQLEALINEGGDTLSIVRDFVQPLLKRPQAADFSVSRENSLPWKPRLESIPESRHSR